MDNRLRRAMLAFKAMPCPDNAMRWASLAARIDSIGTSGKKILDLKKHLNHTYRRLISGLKSFNLSEDSSTEELLVIEPSDILSMKSVGSVTQERLFRGLILEGFTIPDSWDRVITAMQGYSNSLRRAREYCKRYHARN